MRYNLLANLYFLKWIIYPVVFIIAIIIGYVTIFFGIYALGEDEYETPKEKIIDITPKKGRSKSWHDVGGEFRNMLYDTFSGLRKKINKKK